MHLSRSSPTCSLPTSTPFHLTPTHCITGHTAAGQKITTATTGKYLFKHKFIISLSDLIISEPVSFLYTRVGFMKGSLHQSATADSFPL